MRSLIVILITMTTLAVQAQFLGGHDRGNGGDVLVCYDSAGKITSAKFYDLFEAEVKFGMTLIPPQGNTLDEKVDSIISRVEKIDPSRAWAFRVWYKSFFQESKFIPGVELGDIPDQGDALWPVNCKIKQLVVQTDVKPPLNPYRHTFSQDLWNLLDDNSKVATIIHELIFREARAKEHRSSQAVRYLNGLFWADQLNQLSLLDYRKLIIDDLNLLLLTTAEGIPFFNSYYIKKLIWELQLDGLNFNFSIPELQFPGKISNDNGYCTAVYHSGQCRYSVNLVPADLTQLELPTFLGSGSVQQVVFNSNGTLYLGGQFSILSAYSIKSDYFLLRRDEVWETSSSGFTLKYKSQKLIELSYAWSGWKFSELTGLQVEFKAEEIAKVSFILTGNVDYLNCRKSTKLIFEFKYGQTNSLSCVLDRDAELRQYENEKFTRVRAGKRVLVDRNFRLIKVQ